MSKHHLLSIDEDQIRNWGGDRESLLRTIGAAVVLASMSSPTFTVSIRTAGSRRTKSTSRLTINHVGTFESGEGAPTPDISAWTVGDSTCAMDLPADDLEVVVNLAMQDQLGREQGVEQQPEKQGV